MSGLSAISANCGGPTRNTTPRFGRIRATAAASALSTATLAVDTSSTRLPASTRSSIALASTRVLPAPGGPHTIRTPGLRHARYASG
jgi:hypothetical protein